MRSLLTPLALTTVWLVGCTVGNPDLPDAEAQTSNAASAIVVVERGPAGDAIVARFVRARQGIVDDIALRTAGVQDLPSAGTCVTTLLGQSSAGRAVDLLDVGAVTFDSTVLLPRSLPDPAGMVSGYFYSARSTEAFASSRVSLRAAGGTDLPEGFAVSLAAPHELVDVRVSSQTAGLELTWDATDADARDLVYVDVLAPNVVARCSANDGYASGRLAVPANVLGNVEDGSLSVHRVHREAFKTRAIDSGEVRFDLARVVGFRR
jgi:hypothetical protein